MKSAAPLLLLIQGKSSLELGQNVRSAAVVISRDIDRHLPLEIFCYDERHPRRYEALNMGRCVRGQGVEF